MQPSDDPRFAMLSRRHRECLRLSYDRKVTKEIATELGLSIGTVSTYCTEAIRILGARDRRDAAEQLHRHEASQLPGDIPAPDPSRVEPPSKGVETDLPPLPPAVSPEGAASLMRLLPIRRRDATGNDFTVLQRLEFIVLLALVIAVGFGAVASGLRVVSDLVRSIGHS